jgi:hypothetical protein
MRVERCHQKRAAHEIGDRREQCVQVCGVR